MFAAALSIAPPETGGIGKAVSGGCVPICLHGYMAVCRSARACVCIFGRKVKAGSGLRGRLLREFSPEQNAVMLVIVVVVDQPDIVCCVLQEVGRQSGGKCCDSLP